jgi:hypothetical protein
MHIGGTLHGKGSVVAGGGGRPVRAGSIGRDTHGHAELTELPLLLRPWRFIRDLRVTAINPYSCFISMNFL